MGKLYNLTKTQEALFAAWRHIRSNGLTSKSQDTRVAIAAFDEDPIRNIRSIQSKLSADEFDFDLQFGYTKKKSGFGKRGIVLSSIRNRIVERSILDCLQAHCPEVQAVNECPTSVGGVPHRSVPHGLKILVDAFSEGKTYFVRSDISGFFDNIPRIKAIEYVKTFTEDHKFLDLIQRASAVTLLNEEALGDNRKYFPSDEYGVAQGSPLSPLFGNIVLRDFDKFLNDGSSVCVRFIDDFVILAETESMARFQFQRAVDVLGELGLRCHDPFAERADPRKAERGEVSSGFVFLGYHIQPGLLQPSKFAREELLGRVRANLADGRACIKAVKEAQNSFAARTRFVQTLDVLDRVIGGWAEAFSYSDSANTFADLDTKIDEEISNFRSFFRQQIQGLDSKNKRRLLGVKLVGDVRRKSLSQVPKLIKRDGRYVRSTSITVSTDGSVWHGKRSKGLGPGGWAFVTHNSDISASGYELETTNNRMELTAVIKALEAHPEGMIRILSDSQYVVKTASGQQAYAKNYDLWQQYEALTAGRRVKISWVKGHSGDKMNEQADEMANVQSRIASEILGRSGNSSSKAED